MRCWWRTLFGLFPFLRKFYADAGYQGPRFRAAVHRVLPQADLEIVKRPDYAQGFEVLPSAGSSNARSRGSIAAVAWPRIGNA